MERFKDLNWFKSARDTKILVIGNGGIGSWLNVLLARAGILPIIMDFDEVDATNISGQMFFNSQIFMSKVNATAELIEGFGGNISSAREERFSLDTSPELITPITIVGTDNMKSRKDAWFRWKRKYVANSQVKANAMFIDARLLAESFQIFCITNVDDGEIYQNTYLYGDDEVAEISCTAKQTSHYAAGIAFNIVRFVTNFISSLSGVPTYVPFIYNINGLFGDDMDTVEKPGEITEKVIIKEPEVKEVEVEKVEEIEGMISGSVVQNVASGTTYSDSSTMVTDPNMFA